MEVENSSSPNKQQQQPDYDSEEETQAYQEDIQFCFKPERNIPVSLLSISALKSDIIVIATSGHASAYLLAKLPANATCIGYIYNEALKLAEIYGTEDNAGTYVVFEITLPPTIYFEFSRFFFEKFTAPKVVVLDACHPNALPMFPKDSVELPVLRSVVTTKAKGSQTISKPLEDACPVRGISGDVVSYCEVHGMHAELYLLLPSDYDIIVEDILLYENVAKQNKELTKAVDKKQLGTMITRVSSRNIAKDLYL